MVHWYCARSPHPDVPRRLAVGSQVSGVDKKPPEKKVERPAPRQMSPQLMRLASRLEVDPDELATKIPADTIRRTKYPALEEILPDGSRLFKHDLGIHEGPRSSGR